LEQDDMATSRDLPSRGFESYSPEPESGWAAGFLLFAAVVMVIVGLFHFFAGLAAVISNDFLVVEGDYAYEVDVTAWGIGHMILGVVVTVAGGLLLSERTWALIVALVMASISAITGFLSIPNNSAWAIVIVALDIGVIWAVTATLAAQRKARSIT
jgi:hypothetical protein